MLVGDAGPLTRCIDQVERGVEELPWIGAAGGGVEVERVGSMTAVSSAPEALEVGSSVEQEGTYVFRGGEEALFGVSLPTRKSVRLAGRRIDRALERAIVRKSMLREGLSPGAAAGSGYKGAWRDEGGSFYRSSRHRKIRSKWSKCGILLSDEDVRAIMDFQEVPS